MSTEKVIVEKHPTYWLVRINNPERRNALSEAVVDGLIAVTAEVAREKAVRAVILCGAGDKAFCAGADLKERKAMNPDQVRVFVGKQLAMMNAIAASPKVWIAALQGACLGGGLELALSCDLRVANTNTVAGLPEVRLGIIPGAGGTQRLPRLVGMAKAKEMILTGMRMCAEHAQAMGIVNRVAEDHEAAAIELAGELAKAAPISLTQAKRAVDAGWDLPLEAGMLLERACYDVTIPTKDRLEGLQAFAEKRAPNYIGE
ncbi:MAG: enoyl-CoA hydratase/isomerase family protein [Myxococcales bacterium]|nr:enoyl-CoA hydratase/isomerase family protein [Myxococcales bacterium]